MKREIVLKDLTKKEQDIFYGKTLPSILKAMKSDNPPTEEDIIALLEPLVENPQTVLDLILNR